MKLDLTQRPQVRLQYGRNLLPIPDAVAIVEPRDGAYVMVVIGGRDAGGWHGTLHDCEVWIEGFLIGRLGTVGR